jgi:hypothetical protein
MDWLHSLVTNDLFLLFAGLASIISLCLSTFAVIKINITNRNIKQIQSGSYNKQSAGDIN